MKRTILATACLFCATIAMAGSNKHSSYSDTGMKSQSASIQGESVIDQMNDYRYSRTFGVHGMYGVERDQRTAGGPNMRGDAAETSSTGASRMESSSRYESETSMTGAGDKSADKHAEKSHSGAAAWGMKDKENKPAARTETTETTETTTTTSTTGKTADSQANHNERDLEITRQIRQEIMNNDNLSVKAQNLNIVTANGRVSIRGNVDSASEKSSVEQIAKGVSGVTSVDNQVTVNR